MMNNVQKMSNNQNSSLILVVDDETGPRESLKIILSPNYRVNTAADAIEALAILENNNPDLVITDIRMPGLSGTELLRRIKDHDPDMPVILITGYASVESAQEAIRYGAFDYINKPYDVQQIEKTVKKALTEAAERRRKQSMLNQLEGWNQKLRDHLAQLDQKAAVADLSAELIHDLNNPMTVLQGYISLLEESIGNNSGNHLSDQAEDFMVVVKKQVEKCIDMTRSFLDFSRRKKRRWEKGNINQVVQDTLFVLRIRMLQRKIETKVRLNQNIPDSWFMPSSFQQAVYNIINNAIDAIKESGQGSGLIEIYTKLIKNEEPGEDVDQWVVLTIIDNGPGIPEETREKIFTPFYTTKSGDKGTGLGLSICKRVTDEHNGRLVVESKEDVGASFNIFIPFFAESPVSVED